MTGGTFVPEASADEALPDSPPLFDDASAVDEEEVVFVELDDGGVIISALSILPRI